MASFIERIFGGGIPPERREVVLAYLADEWKLQALQDAEGGRHNEILTKYGGSVTPGSSALTEVLSSAGRQSQVYADLRQRHTELGPVPDEVGACYFKWHGTYLALEEWALATLAAFEGLEAGETPHAGRIEQLLATEQTAERDARKEEAKLHKRLGLSVEDLRRLWQESEAAAESEDK